MTYKLIALMIEGSERALLTQTKGDADLAIARHQALLHAQTHPSAQFQVEWEGVGRPDLRSRVLREDPNQNIIKQTAHVINLKLRGAGRDYLQRPRADILPRAPMQQTCWPI